MPAKAVEHREQPPIVDEVEQPHDFADPHHGAQVRPPPPASHGFLSILQGRRWSGNRFVGFAASVGRNAPSAEQPPYNPHSLALHPGTRLGAYEVTAPSGAGGMGEVYKGRDTRLNRVVAIKILASDIAHDASLRARFEREAQAVAALDHPHICGIYDVGEANGTHFLVMPYLEGQTLAARLENGALPPDDTLKIATELADALEKAHRKGIIHRDLKPANIMLTKAGSKLLDFGIAKLKAPASSMAARTGGGTATLATAHGTVLGTGNTWRRSKLEGKDADKSPSV